MISQINGVVEQFSENTLTVGVGGISYEVSIPTATLKGLSGRIHKDAKISLVTYH